MTTPQTAKIPVACPECSQHPVTGSFVECHLEQRFFRIDEGESPQKRWCVVSHLVTCETCGQAFQVVIKPGSFFVTSPRVELLKYTGPAPPSPQREGV